MGKETFNKIPTLKHPLTDKALREDLPGWGVLVLESYHSPAFAMEWRTHEFFKIVYVWKGRGKFHIGDEIHDFAACDVIVIPPGIRNRIVDDPTAASSLYICCIASRLLEFDHCLIQTLTSRLHRHPHGFANRVATLLRRMVHTQQKPVPTTSIGMVADAMRLMQVVLELHAKPRPMEPQAGNERAVIQQYIATLPNRFFEESSIDSISHDLGIPRRSFTQLFHELTGETWLAHIRRLAIEHAQKRLHHTDLPITSVAFESGFQDLSTFYRQFKKHVGMSPGEYRSSQTRPNQS